MRGLLRKDWKLVKNQKQFFLTMGAIALFFLVLYDNPYFLVGYMTIVFSTFSVNTIAYDEADNGNAYLFTLPISRKIYVREKYFFGILLMVITWGVISGCAAAACIIRGIEYEKGEFLSVSLASLGIAVFFLAFMIPMQLKFGTAKTKTAALMIVGIAFFLSFVLVRLADMFHTGFGGIFKIFSGLKLANIAVMIGIIWVILVTASYLLSVKIMEKKEF